MLPEWFREYLSYHRTERRGLYVLIALLIVLIGYNMYQRFFWKSEWEQVRLEYGAEIVRFNARLDSLHRPEHTEQLFAEREKSYFPFDPNSLDSAGWVRLGFSPKQSAAIIRYRETGAMFRKPEDLKKLFVVDDARFAELQPYIRIRQTPETEYPKEPDRARSLVKRVPVLVELNSADTAQLQQLYGIGPSFAGRIVKYRQLLGGYIDTEQLLEVYGMDSVRYSTIAEHVVIDTTIRARININTADVKELLRHPYINRNQARAIVNYRMQHGNYRSASELSRIHLFTPSDLQRIRPYVTVE